MSHTIRTPSLPGARQVAAREPVDELDRDLVVSPGEILERLWRIFTSMRTALVLILCLAGLGLAGTLLVQAPPGLKEDPQAYAGWLDTIRPRYGGWTTVLDALQLFAVFSSVWFKGIVVALVTSIMACSVNRFRGLWRTAVHPRTRMSSIFYDRAPHGARLEVGAGPEAVLDSVRAAFRGRRFRIVIEPEGEVVHLYADRFRWAPFGTLLAHLSLVLILVGALIGSSFGFRNPEFAVPVGSRVEVGNGTGLTVEAVSFNDTYYPNGAPSDYASQLVLYRGNEPVARQTVRVNEPLRYGDVTFYQSFFGAAAAIRIADPSGRTLFDQGVPLLWGTKDGKRRVGQVQLPDQGLTIYVVGAASGEVDPEIRPGQMQLEVYRTGGGSTPVATAIVSQGQPARLADLDVTFARERQFTGLIVARDPGVPLVWGGALLLVAGLFLVFFFPNRRIWARLRRTAEGSELLLGATTRHDATFGAEFQQIVTEMALALDGPGAA